GGVIVGRLRLFRGRGVAALARRRRVRLRLLLARATGFAINRRLLRFASGVGGRLLVYCVFFLFVCHLFPELFLDVDAALSRDGQKLGDVAFGGAKAGRVLQLAR